MTFARWVTLTLLVAIPLSLAGCGDGGLSDLRQWMDQVQRDTKVRISKLAAPKKFVPFSYGGKDSVDPFNPSKLAAAFARLKPTSADALKPDFERRREPLEGFPLDTVKMVGTLNKPGLNYALLQVDKLVYQVKVGNYIGQNFGMVTGITDSAVEINERVQDAVGDWVERKTKLELQETKK